MPSANFFSLKVVRSLGAGAPRARTTLREKKFASCMDYSSKNGLTGNLNAASFSSSPLAKTSLVKCLLTLLYVTTKTCISCIPRVRQVLLQIDQIHSSSMSENKNKITLKPPSIEGKRRRKKVNYE